MTPDFMNGVELIGTTISRQTELWELIFAAILFLGAAACFIYGAISSIRNKKKGYAADFAVAIGFILCFCLTLNSYLDTTTNYVVQVEDSVSMNEFTENYNIVGHVNDKYVINIKDAGNIELLSD